MVNLNGRLGIFPHNPVFVLRASLADLQSQHLDSTHNISTAQDDVPGVPKCSAFRLLNLSGLSACMVELVELLFFCQKVEFTT